MLTNMKKLSVFLLSLLIALSVVSAAEFPLDRSGLNSLDRAFIFNYSKTQDTAATILDIGIAATPAVIALGGESDLLTLGTMYAETMATAWISKEILKNAVGRARPYLYTDSVPTELEDEWYESFPSGHTTMAFAGAAFTSYVFSEYYPDSRWKLPLTLACYGLAGTAGILRITSGNHFPTDVLGGALLGTAIGFGVPMLHKLSRNVKAGISPFGLLVDISF